MEPKANYIGLGLLVVVSFCLAFGAIYWLLRYNENGDTRNVTVLVPGSAAGLADGSAVLFNGIRVGRVLSLGLDAADPGKVFVQTEINVLTPIKEDTRVEIETQVLSGLASIVLSGGSKDKPNLLDQKGEIQLTARQSGLDGAIEAATNTLALAEDVLVQVKKLVDENGDSVGATVKNIETFSSALASNAEGVDDFLKNVGAAAKSLEGLSAKLDLMSDDVAVLVKSVDPEKVSKTLENVEAITGDIRNTTARIDQVFNSVDGAVEQLGTFTTGLNATLANVNGVVNKFGGEQVDEAIANINSAAAKLNGTLTKVDGLVDAIEPQTIQAALKNVTEFTDGLDKIGTQIDDMLEEGKEAAGDVRKFTQNLSGQTESVNKIIQNAEEISTKLITTSEAINRLVGRVDGLVDEEGDSLIVEATEAARAIRRIAENFEARANNISGGLERFSTRGLRDIEELIAQSRRAVANVEKTVSQFENNPSRFIFGKPNVPEYNGRQRR